MSTTSSSTSGRSVDIRDRSTWRLSTETKAAYKTTEFLTYIVAVIAVAIAAQVIGDKAPATTLTTSAPTRPSCTSRS